MSAADKQEDMSEESDQDSDDKTHEGDKPYTTMVYAYFRAYSDETTTELEKAAQAAAAEEFNLTPAHSAGTRAELQAAAQAELEEKIRLTRWCHEENGLK